MRKALLFGEPDSWPDSDCIMASEHLPAEMLVQAYREGVFPMPTPGLGFGHTLWFSPVRRGILPLDGLRVSRSLRKTAPRYRLTVDTDLPGVLAGCADPHREHGWIDADVVADYTDLFRRGLLHTVEARDASGRLVGGLYGVGIGGLFAGESMFHDPRLGRDASKAALIGLVHVLSTDGRPRLLDVQWRTDHLRSLGVVEISRRDYLDRAALAVQLPAADWPAEIDIEAALRTCSA